MPDITDKITQEYDASQIQVLEGLEAVRKRPGMYIGSTSSSGLHHLVYEIVDNSIDEALAGYCSHIELTIEPGDIICVSDNGRGIPVDIQPQTGKSALEVVFTVLHAGGKFGGGGYKVSGGLHGVGASVVNALSEWLEVNVHKNGKIYQMKFSRGDITQPMTVVGETDHTGTTVQKALAKVRGLNPTTICSTHGPVWQRQIPQVMDIYDRLSRYEGEPGVVLAYGSMYGNTEQMAERIARELASRGVGPIVMYNLSFADESVVLRDVFRYDTLIVGAPTYNGGIYPPAARLLDLIAARCVPQRNFGWFGSFCWAGAAVRGMGEFAQRMKWEPICDPVEMKQGFSSGCHDFCSRFADGVAERFRR